MNDPAFANFGESLVYYRKRKSWTQQQLAACIGRTRARVSDLELNRRPASLDEISWCAKALGVSRTALGAPIRKRSTRIARKTRTRFGQRSLPRYKKDRPNFTRYRKARETSPALFIQMLARIRARADRPAVGRYVHEALVESDLEALWEMHKLAANGRPCLVSPMKAGFREIPVVTPGSQPCMIGDLRFPALEFQGPHPCIIFPQTTLKVGQKYPCPDNLVGVCHEGRLRWLLVEVNGEGHQERKLDLDLPILVLKADDVRSIDCWERFWSKLDTLLKAHA